MLEGDVIEFVKSGLLVVVQREIARGSFGTVFRAMDRTGTRFAIKQCLIEAELNLRQIESEVNVLAALSHLEGNWPKLVDYTVRSDGSGSSQSMILMTLLPGVPLQSVLPVLACDRLEMAFSMLQELLPTLKQLDIICCHRDLNSHNILFYAASRRFSVVDFGLAVDKSAWCYYRWRDAAVGGDARYWPVCAWRMLLSGWSAMTPSGVEQYKEKLDMHSFAITQLEVICSGPCPAPLREAWDGYWSAASEFARLFHQCFVEKGQWANLKANLSELRVTSIVARHLKNIKRVLKTLRSEHPVYEIVERMLCVNDVSPTASWSYISNAVEIASTKIFRNLSVHALRVHY